MRAAWAVFAVVWAGAATAWGQAYRFPMDGDSYPTAYVDHGGRDWHGGDHTYGGHGGSDFGVGSWPAMDAGRDVLAAGDGEVVGVHDGEFDRCTTADCAGGGGYGNHVRIRHGDGKTTIYAHLRRGSVAVGNGARVSCGQRIGQVGSSGWSAGPHLHFEVRRGGGATDDPFAGPLSGPLSYWVEQGAYMGLPARRCDGRNDGGGGGQGPAERRDEAAFVSEEVPDGTRFETGQWFTKVWRMRNTGNTAWTRGESYLWTHDGDERFGAPEQVQLGDGERVEPGQEKEWRVEMAAPDRPGRYRGYWKMDRFGTHRFGDRVWVEIEVVEARRDDASLASESPDAGHRVAPGTRFAKTLRVHNAGNTAWTAGERYLLTHDDDGRFGAPEQTVLPDGARVEPGAEWDFTFELEAPAEPGEHSGWWRMDRFGTARFGARFQVRFVVDAPPPPAEPDAVGGGRDDPAPDEAPAPAGGDDGGDEGGGAAPAPDGGDGAVIDADSGGEPGGASFPAPLAGDPADPAAGPDAAGRPGGEGAARGPYVRMTAQSGCVTAPGTPSSGPGASWIWAFIALAAWAARRRAAPR